MQKKERKSALSPHSIYIYQIRCSFLLYLKFQKVNIFKKYRNDE